MSDLIIGIDLGTSNCCVAVVGEDGKPRVVTDDKKRRTTPSVISFHPQGNVLIGHDAKTRRVIDPRHTVSSFKRLIGRRFNSPETKEQMSRSAYLIKPGANEQPVVSVRAGEFTPSELSAILLDHQRNLVKAATGQEIRRAVVTVPANFNDAQRQATALAGEIADLVVVRILNEPTAAALAYGHGRALERTVAVYDFGGGTLDVTILQLRDNVYEVLATAGDTFLGGDDVDEKIVDLMVELFLQQHRFDLRADDMAMQRLRAVAEHVKCELSSKPKAVVTVQELAVGVGGAALDLHFTLTREELVNRIRSVIERSFPVCDEAFRLASLAPAQIDDVVLVGGTTKIPYVRECVATYFGKMPRTDVDPDEAVALGAALQGHALAQVLDKPARRATTVTAAAPPPTPRASTPPPAPTPVPALPPPAIGRMPLQKVAVTPKPKTTQPLFREVNSAERKDFTGSDTGVGTEERTFNRAAPGEDMLELGGADLVEESTSVSAGPGEQTIVPPGPPPLESPAAPAPPAPPAAPRSLMPSMPPPMRPVLLDVTPRALCVATVGGYCDEIIRRNAQIPIEQTRVFTTAVDGQTAVEIKVGQGESRRFDENAVLGTLILDGLDKKLRGEVKIAVTFEIDTDGILQVRAVDQASKRAQSARIQLLGVANAEEVAGARDRLQQLRR